MKDETYLKYSELSKPNQYEEVYEKFKFSRRRNKSKNVILKLENERCPPNSEKKQNHLYKIY